MREETGEGRRESEGQPDNHQGDKHREQTKQGAKDGVRRQGFILCVCIYYRCRHIAIIPAVGRLAQHAWFRRIRPNRAIK